MRDGESFLPNFCAIRSVFALVVVGELLAFVLVLTRPGGGWQELALVSLFVQWIALASAALLCLLRSPLARLGNVGAALAGHLIVVAITALVTEAGWRLLQAPAGAEGHLAFLVRGVAVGAIVAAVVLRYLYVQHNWRLRLQSNAQARIEALQARIRPHFLFNSLNTIASLIPAAPADAERLVEELADLFRASLAQADRLIPLGDELALVDGYLHMEGLRLGERLRVGRRLDGLPIDALIPPLTLQPLIENAVYYGIEPRRGGGELVLAGRRDGDLLEVTVRNPLPAPPSPRRGGLGMAQQNVRERLALAFGRRAALEAGAREGVYHVTVRFPYRRGATDEDSHR